MLVRHELAALHEGLGLPPRLAVAGHLRAQQVARRKVPDAEVVAQADALRAFAAAGRSEEEHAGHGLVPPEPRAAGGFGHGTRIPYLPDPAPRAGGDPAEPRRASTWSAAAVSSPRGASICRWALR